jgi:hypothetical protein
MGGALPCRRNPRTGRFLHHRAGRRAAPRAARHGRDAPRALQCLPPPRQSGRDRGEGQPQALRLRLSRLDLWRGRGAEDRPLHEGQAEFRHGLVPPARVPHRDLGELAVRQSRRDGVAARAAHGAAAQADGQLPPRTAQPAVHGRGRVGDELEEPRRELPRGLPSQLHPSEDAAPDHPDRAVPQIPRGRGLHRLSRLLRPLMPRPRAVSRGPDGGGAAQLDPDLRLSQPSDRHRDALHAVLCASGRWARRGSRSAGASPASRPTPTPPRSGSMSGSARASTKRIARSWRRWRGRCAPGISGPARSPPTISKARSGTSIATSPTGWALSRRLSARIAYHTRRGRRPLAGLEGRR